MLSKHLLIPLADACRDAHKTRFDDRCAAAAAGCTLERKCVLIFVSVFFRRLIYCQAS